MKGNVPKPFLATFSTSDATFKELGTRTPRSPCSATLPRALSFTGKVLLHLCKIAKVRKLVLFSPLPVDGPFKPTIANSQWCPTQLSNECSGILCNKKNALEQVQSLFKFRTKAKIQLKTLNLLLLPTSLVTHSPFLNPLPVQQHHSL